MPPLEHTYPSLASHSPTLRIAEPALSLMLPSPGRACLFVGNGDFLDAGRMRLRLVVGTEEIRIASNQVRSPVKNLFVLFHRMAAVRG